MAPSGEPVLWSLYVYAPNKGAPIFFTITYGISAFFHIWQCYRYKAWKLMWLHALCATLLTVGYALREWGAFNYLYSLTDKTPLIIFVLSQVFIYVCPPLLELSNYHILGRVFYYVPSCAPLPASRVLATFGGLMAAVEALNAVGVSLAVNPSGDSQSLGKSLIIAAISMQIVVIVTFVSLAALFHVRFVRARIGSHAVRTILLVLYASMTLIFVRCIYRLVEHSGNIEIELNDIEVLRRLSPLLRYEVFFYVFEATLMLLNSWLWNAWHPGRFLPRENHIYLAEDGTEVTGEKEEDSRPLLAKMGHVLSFGILFRKTKGGHHRIHELSEFPPNDRGHS
ncbi:hypothetical protein VTH82DRAFT_7106 [Thermothelomyces myriococcoides]